LFNRNKIIISTLSVNAVAT